MRRRIHASLLVSLLATSWVAPAWADVQKAEATQRVQLRWKSPFKRGLPALDHGPLVHLGGKAHVDAQQYKDLSAATQHLLREYPPESHYFVGLGRDPAPIVAFLQNLGGKQLAVNFPASSNQKNKATVEVMAQYVRKLIPEEVLASGKTIVFVDATTTGRGLDHYVPLIAPSLRGAKVIKAAYGIRGPAAPTKIYLSPGDKRVIETTAFPEVNKFFTDPYEDVVSEFPRHGPGLHDIRVLDTPRPEYQQYRDALMQRMERDEGLHEFLKAQGFGHEETP